MLVGKMVRVRFSKNRVIPCFIDPRDEGWLEAADQLLGLFRSQEGITRNQLTQDILEMVGEDPSQLIYLGLAKLLEDRCEFEVVSGLKPEEIRNQVFSAATRHRVVNNNNPKVNSFDRNAVLQEVANRLAVTPEQLDAGLFADLKGEQRLKKYRDISPENLLHRYNLALVQSILLRSTQLTVVIHHESANRYRQLLRQAKFHRLICDIAATGPETFQLKLDGPLSLFSATQKYGMQLANFLPHLIHCRNFNLEADLFWGPTRKAKQFTLKSSDGLQSHLPDQASYLPLELRLFVELFRKRIPEWELEEEPSILSLGNSYWVPDFVLRHKLTNREVLFEVLGYWRKSSAEAHLQRLAMYAKEKYILAVSDQLHIDDVEITQLQAGIHRFKQMPLPDEIVRLATEALEL